MGERLPRREKVPSCSTCSSFACRMAGISPISSRKMVPPVQTSNFPGLVFTAPVKAPCS